MEHHHILDSVDGLPDVISGRIFMGKVAIDASDGAVSTHLKPCIILRLHDVARSTEFGGFRPGHELRRTEAYENASDHCQYKDSCKD